MAGITPKPDASTRYQPEDCHDTCMILNQSKNSMKNGNRWRNTAWAISEAAISRSSVGLVDPRSWSAVPPIMRNSLRRWTGTWCMAAFNASASGHLMLSDMAKTKQEYCMGWRKLKWSAYWKDSTTINLGNSHKNLRRECPVDIAKGSWNDQFVPTC
jgi:hypothetical protein